MHKFVDWLYDKIYIIQNANMITMVGSALLIYIYVIGPLPVQHGLFPYHNTVQVVEEVDCNPHLKTCRVVGNINDTYTESLIINNEYNITQTYYQNCTLLFYTWHCRNELTIEPMNRHERHHDEVRGN